MSPSAPYSMTFAFTAANENWIDQQIAKYPQGRQASAVIPLLWRAQEQHEGWLPEPAMRVVAEMLGIGSEEEPQRWNATERALLDAKIAAREPFLDFIYSRTNADGSMQYLQVSGEPMFDNGSRFIGYRGIGLDVSERLRRG